MVDDDDLFVYGADGTPVGLKASPAGAPALNKNELHDVIVATTAANDLEAIALIESLEDAGIPAMKRNGMVHFGGAGQCEVVVPRKLFEHARTAIQKFRGDASERGIQDAFNPERVVEHQSDPRSIEMTLMGMLAEARDDERERILSQFVAKAIADSMSAPELAQHLAAAGLNREEADAMIENVKTKSFHLIRERLEFRIHAGTVIGIVGAFVLGLSLVALFAYRMVTPLYHATSVIGMVIGFGLAADAKAKLAALGKK